MHLSKPVAVVVRAIAACAITASAATPAFAQVNHNAPTKFGATFYSWKAVPSNPGYTVLPPENIYPPTLNWNINHTAWWHGVVDDADDAGLGYLTVAGWGWNSNSDPADIVPQLLSALTARGSGMKVALFDDVTAAVLQKNRAKGRDWTTNVPFDLADSGGSGEGGWYYFYDYNWRRHFQAMAADPGRRLEVDGRPVVFMWHGDKFSNEYAFSNLVAALRAATINEFGFNPYIIVEDSWLVKDPDTVVDATFDWFEPGTRNGTLSYHNGVQVGVAIPGYDGTRFNDPEGPRPGPAPRNNGTTYTNALNLASVGDLVLIESINNVEENAHLMQSPNWGSQYIDITRAYAYPGPGQPPGGDSELTQGEFLNPGGSINSPDNRFTFTYQLDGNIVLYWNGYYPLWASGTAGVGASGQLLMQPDGNLVLYAGGGVPFHTGTFMYPGAKLKVQIDGNVVIYDANGQWRWQTGTCCH